MLLILEGKFYNSQNKERCILTCLLNSLFTSFIFINVFIDNVIAKYQK